MEKQPASYMHENWQSGPGAACEPFEFWKPRPTSAAASTTPVDQAAESPFNTTDYKHETGKT